MAVHGRPCAGAPTCARCRPTGSTPSTGGAGWRQVEKAALRRLRVAGRCRGWAWAASRRARLARVEIVTSHAGATARGGRGAGGGRRTGLVVAGTGNGSHQRWKRRCWKRRRPVVWRSTQTAWCAGRRAQLPRPPHASAGARGADASNRMRAEAPPATRLRPPSASRRCCRWRSVRADLVRGVDHEGLTGGARPCSAGN